MISFVRGILSAIGEGKVEIDTGMMGFEINVPAAVFDTLPSLGDSIQLYTYLNVKEDEMSLYGFTGRDMLEMFRLLISVSGIGPKGALGILSVMDVSDLRFSILAGDAKTISKAPGIGAKTAQRLIIELKDKVSFEDMDGSEITVTQGSRKKNESDTETSAKAEAVDALTVLGYSSTDALRAVNAVDTKYKSTEQILKEALNKLGR